MKLLPVVQFGLGPIGLASVKAIAERPGWQLLGAIDNDPAKAGRSLAEVTGLPHLPGHVYPDFASLWAAGLRPVAVFHTAGSRVASALAQMRPMVEHGLAVVSTCEELIFPALREPALTAEYDALCRQHGGRIVAAGVNPGFVMDVLPLVVSHVCRSVRRLHVTRVVNASLRRQPLQAKIGSGMAPADYLAALQAGRMGHAGFAQSLALLAHGLGWTLDRWEEVGEPVVAERPIRTSFFDVAPGQCCGTHQTARGWVNGEKRLTLDLWMYLDAPDPRDHLKLESDPPMEVLIPGGTAGDSATIGALLNTLPKLLAAAPGLHLPTALPLPGWRA